MTASNPPPPDATQPNPQDPLEPDAPPPLETQQPPPAVAAPPAPPKRRRRWPKVVVGILLLLALLVIFAPTIAGTAPVRSFILGRVNDTLKGRIHVGDWALGWTSGIQVQDLKVFDAQESLVLGVSRLTTDLTLLEAVRGDFDAGDVTLDEVTFRFTHKADGNFNFPEPKSPAAEPDSDEPTKLPNVRANVRIKSGHGTFEDATPGSKVPVVHVRSLSGEALIADINGPI